ncbi:MAG: ROK family protein [Bacteroides sp.]|nr:ROK family protein [Bacteroides sp.]
MTPLYPPFTIGVDLGGTNTVLAIVDSVGHIVAIDSFPTATPDIGTWADILAHKIKDMIRTSDLDGHIKGIGIGAPCANAVTGSIEAATDLPWPSPIPLANMVQARLQLPTVVTNDANAAAIGEMTYGAAAGMKNFIVLTLGTGVGAGVVCDGHLLSGTRGFAGELGHVTFPFAADRPCGCGRSGCLQTVASAKGILTTARHLLSVSSEPSSLRGIPEEKLTAKDICEAAHAGDSLAKEIYEYTGHCLGKAAAEFAALTDPEAIIIFGGVANAGDLLLPPMRDAFSKNALHLYRDRVRFLKSGLEGANAAVLGAASLPMMKR